MYSEDVKVESLSHPISWVDYFIPSNHMHDTIIRPMPDETSHILFSRLEHILRKLMKLYVISRLRCHNYLSKSDST